VRYRGERSLTESARFAFWGSGRGGGVSGEGRASGLVEAEIFKLKNLVNVEVIVLTGE
jgi:hypothetical protein